MKVKVLNKETSIFITENRKAKYSDLLMYVFDTPVPQDVSLNVMRRDFRIMDIIEAGNNSTELEFDLEDFTLIADKVANSKWKVVSRDIVAFADYIKSLNK